MYKADQRYIVDFLSWGAGDVIRVRAEAIDFAATERLMQRARDLGMDVEEAFAAVMEKVRSQRKPL